MSYEPEDSYDVYNEQIRVARITHVCAACNDPISPGHDYAHVGIVWDGVAWTIKRCARCQTLHLHLRKLGERVGRWPDERLQCGMDYVEEWGPIPPDIEALAFAPRGTIQLRKHADRG